MIKNVMMSLQAGACVLQVVALVGLGWLIMKMRGTKT